MRRYIFLLISFSILTSAALPTIISGHYTFAFDMGRDLLWVRNMVELKKPTLIGPWGSIAGVYFGPLWYYLLAIPYVVFNGDPRGAVLIPLAANLLTIFIGWKFLYPKNPDAANIFVIFYASSRLIINISSFPFHANLLPLVTLLFVIGLYQGSTFCSKRLNLWGFPLATLATSLAFHLEPAAAIMLTLFLLGFETIYFYRNLRYIKCFKTFYILLISFCCFAVPFVPQIIFETRHDFIQSKSLVSYFKGENASLGGVLPLNNRLTERITKLADTLTYSTFQVSSTLFKWIMFGSFLFGLFSFLLPAIRRKNGDKIDNFTLFIFSLTLSFIIFHYFAYTFIFPAELKGWYLSGFPLVYILALSIMTSYFLKNSSGRIKYCFYSIILISIIRNYGLIDIFRKPTPSGYETLAAQKQAIDWIYQDHLSKPLAFSIYTYTPPIYDYNYQYLIWWMGTKKYHLLPAEYSYLPGETSYLPEKQRFISRQWQSQDAELIYLVIEPARIEKQRQGWLGHFAKCPVILSKTFTSGVTAEIRTFH